VRCFTTSSLFFFQAEDGIRVRHVTGVQTCALPIFPALIARQSIVELSGGSHEVLHGHLCGPNVCAHVMISFFMFVTVMIDGCIGRCGAHTSAFLTFHLPSISSHSAMNFSPPRAPRIAHTSASLTLSSRFDRRSWCENVASTSYPACWAAL